MTRYLKITYISTDLSVFLRANEEKPFYINIYYVTEIRKFYLFIVAVCQPFLYLIYYSIIWLAWSGPDPTIQKVVHGFSYNIFFSDEFVEKKRKMNRYSLFRSHLTTYDIFSQSFKLCRIVF